MGFTAINAGDEFLSAAILNEIVDAIRERQTVLGAALTPSVTDDDVQVNTFWATVAGLQLAVEDLVAAAIWVDHTISGGDYSGLDAIPLFTLATWRTAAGLHADGFMAVDAAGTDHRLLEADDFINKHLVNELQAGLTALKWTYHGVAWDAKGEAVHNQGDGFWATQALAEAGAQADYDTEPYNLPAIPLAHTHSNTSIYGWFALVRRGYAYLKWEGAAPAKDIDFYIKGNTLGDSFNGNGDFPGGYTPGTLYLCETLAAVSGETVYSSAFGHGPPGNYPAWPSGGDESTGYECDGAGEAVVKWDFVY